MEMDAMFEKVKNSLERGVAAVSIKSNEFVEITKLKGELARLEDEIYQIKAELGDAYLHQWKSSITNHTILTNHCTEIVQKEVQINDILKKIEEIKAVTERGERQSQTGRMCSCGKINSQDARFCASCGGKLNDTQQAFDGD